MKPVAFINWGEGCRPFCQQLKTRGSFFVKLFNAWHFRLISFRCLLGRQSAVSTKGPFIATQLNSTQLDVELSCVAIDTLTDATQLSPTIGNATDPVEQRTANQREAGQSFFVWSICHINSHVFSHNSINFSSNSSLQNSISRQTRQNTSFMTSLPTN